MYDIRQFRPSLYLLLLLGVSGFALASQSGGIWVLAVGALFFNAWFVRSGRFKPLPRFVANVITLLSLLYVFLVLRQMTGTPILVIGQFLVFLQIVKLFEQRGNRDYAQMLVLSLLLMVAAAISTATLVFGILFVVYLFLSLYCCLLFHLKVETDYAKAAIGLPEEKLNPMTLRQDQRYLPRSMRRLTALVSVFAVSTAVLVFLFFPRNTGAGLLGPFQFRPQTMTGFSDKMSFQQVAQITQNAEIVAYVKVWHDGRPVEGTRPLLLRGVTLEVYTGNAPNSVAWQWLRPTGADLVYDIEPGRTIEFADLPVENTWRQEVMLQPTGTDVLFAIAGVSSVKSMGLDQVKVRYLAADRSMRSDPAISQPARYEAISSGQILLPPGSDLLVGNSEAPNPVESSGDVPAPAIEVAADAQLTDPQSPEAGPTPATAPSGVTLPGLTGITAVAPAQTDGGQLTRSWIDPQIAEYARRPAVSGEDSTGSLAARRPIGASVTALDIPIAKSIERHLTGADFRYTLDLSDARRVGDRDPIVAFLFDLKRGHCEYFAGAMTLLCQSLGMQSRVVIGFKCDEYNPLTNSYVVRQSHAHAWVEVLGTDGQWITFDPTSGREAPPRSGAAAAWNRVKQVFDYLEYTWANSVVAYDREARTNMIENVEKKLGNAANEGSITVKRAKRWFEIEPTLEGLGRYWTYSSKVIVFLISAMLVTLLAAVMWFVYERWRIRRRARRIGLGALPRDAQLRLARQLGFYDDLMRLFSRHRISCPAHLTPREFSRTLTFLPAELFDQVSRLTGIFYRVRYGKAELSPVQQRRLRAMIGRIESGLSPQANR